MAIRKTKPEPAHWLIDEQAAEIVRRIFRLCVEGYGPTQIANILFSERVFQHPQSIGRHRGERPLRFLPYRINGRQGRLQIFWNGECAVIRSIFAPLPVLSKIRPKFTDQKKNGKSLKIRMKLSLILKLGNLCRNSEVINADQTVQVRSVSFLDCYIAAIAAKNCITA